MRAIRSAFKKQDAAGKHFRAIVQQRTKSRSVKMEGVNFLEMVLDYLKQHEATIRTGEKTLSLKLRHLTFICRRFQKNNVGPFAHKAIHSAASHAEPPSAESEAELLLLVNLMVAFSNVVSLRVEVQGIEAAGEGEQRESLVDIPSSVCPMDLFPSLCKLHLRGCPMRYFDNLHIFASQALEIYVEYIPMGCLSDLFDGIASREDEYESYEVGRSRGDFQDLEDDDTELMDDDEDQVLVWEKLRILFVRYCNLVDVGDGLGCFPNVLHIDLQHNRLTAVNSLFKLARRACQHLQNLDLSFNFIAALTDTIIDPMTNTSLLGTSVAKSAEVGSYLARSLGKHGSSASNRHHKRTLRKLRTLSLRSNRITTLAGVDEVGLVAVERLDLSDNMLSELRELGSLAPLEKLQKLQLQGNPIQFLKNYRSLVLAVMMESRRAYAQYVQGFVNTSTMSEGKGQRSQTADLAELDGVEVSKAERDKAAQDVTFDETFSSIQMGTASKGLSTPMLDATPSGSSYTLPSGGFIRAAEPPATRATTKSSSKRSRRARQPHRQAVDALRAPEEDGLNDADDGDEIFMDDIDGGAAKPNSSPDGPSPSGSNRSLGSGGGGSNRSVRKNGSSRSVGSDHRGSNRSIRSGRGASPSCGDENDAVHEDGSRKSKSRPVSGRLSNVAVIESTPGGNEPSDNSGSVAAAGTAASASSLAKGEMWARMKQLREAHGPDWLQFVDELKTDLPPGTQAASANSAPSDASSRQLATQDTNVHSPSSQNDNDSNTGSRSHNGSNRSIRSNRSDGSDSSRSLTGKDRSKALKVVAAFRQPLKRNQSNSTRSLRSSARQQPSLLNARQRLKKMANSQFAVSVMVAEMYRRRLIVSYNEEGDFLLVETDAKSGNAKRTTPILDMDRVKFFQIDAETALLEVWFSVKHCRSFDIGSEADCAKAKTLHEAIHDLLQLQDSDAVEDDATLDGDDSPQSQRSPSQSPNHKEAPAWPTGEGVLTGSIHDYSSRVMCVEVAHISSVLEVPISDVEAFDDPEVTEEALLNQFGVATTIADLIVFVGNKSHRDNGSLDGSDHGSAPGIGFSVQLCHEDSERLKMPRDSITAEASLDQLWRWGIRQLEAEQLSAKAEHDTVAADGERSFDEDRAVQLDPEAAAAAAAAADLALRSEIGAVDEAQGRWLIGQNGDVQEDSANAAAHPDWQYFVKLSYGTTAGLSTGASADEASDSGSSRGVSISETPRSSSGSFRSSSFNGRRSNPIDTNSSRHTRNLPNESSPAGSYSMSGMGSLPVAEHLEDFFRNEVISRSNGDDIDIIERMGLLPYRTERVGDYAERPVVVLIKSKTFFMLEDQCRDHTFRDRPFFPLIVQRGLDSLYRVVIGFKFQRIRLDFEDTWDEEDDPSGCNNSYVLLSRDQKRTLRFLSKLQQHASFSIENEDVQALDAIKGTVLRPSEPQSAKVKMYMMCHVDTQDAFNSEGGLVPRSLVVTSNYIYLCVENYGAAKPTFERVVAYINRLSHSVVLQDEASIANGGAAIDLAAEKRGKADLSMTLVITSKTKKLFRKKTESRWHLVAPSKDAKEELAKELKQAPV